ncbi:hypothetical protein ZIOFF_033470 [Zingiber officinale]|uniref:Reverse transcriptase RNase H-like domain-containing protein n=1 Tax=Zingiber officinale TaxID=94328 RepID=A0A8J5GKC3_ZINOF|nr:hypothetical protein ZIOFF_033470 [Zingiber officinale]
MNSHDWALVHKIKKRITDLLDLAIPFEKCYIILETDGCMEGWGGICKWKSQKYDPKSEEKICAYASGKYSPIKSTIDAEIYVVMNNMNNFKIYYLDKPELIIRTDYQTIISFFNKTTQNKPSRVRTMDSDEEGSSSTNPNRRSIITNPGQAQYEGISSSSRPYHLLEQYAELACSEWTSILHPEEHDKRSHMADIEWTAARNVDSQKPTYSRDNYMSRRWEIAIQEWYSKSPIANLEYLDLAETKPTMKELAHNIAIIYDSRINLKNFKQTQEELESLKVKNKKLLQAVKDLTQEVLESRLLTERQIISLVTKVVEQPKAIEERTVKLTEDLSKKLERVEKLLYKLEAWTSS